MNAKVELRETPIDRKLNRLWGAGHQNLRVFLDMVSDIYRDDPQWVRPLDADLKGRLTPKNPFFDHAEAILLTAFRNGNPVGRCTAQVDHEHLARHQDSAGFFGFFDTIDDSDVAKALLDRAAAWLKSKGMKTIRGPFSLNTNEETGCLVEGFDTPPMIMMPHHRAYQGGLIEKAGLTKLKDLYAWRYTVGDIPKRAQKGADEIAALAEVSTRPADLKHMDRDVRIVMDIFNDAWSDNWGFVPLTSKELKKAASDMKLILNPELTIIVSVNGEPSAFAIALPNINTMIRDLNGKLSPTGLAKLLWRLKIQGPRQARLAFLGVRKGLRHTRKYAGLSAYMYVKMHEAGERLGIRWGELSWTLEDNGPVNAGIKLMGGKIYKRYRVYERAL